VGWTTGVVGLFDPVPSIGKKLDRFEYVRTEKHLRTGKKFKLTSVVRLDERQINLDRKVKILSGMVIDEHIVTPMKLAQDDEGTFIVVDGKPYTDVQYGKFWLTTESIAIAENRDTMTFTFSILSQAIGGDSGIVRHVRFDIGRIARDYDRHWIGSFYDRRGRMQSGTIYGDAIEDEELIKGEYYGWKKNRVGFVTDYFGAPTKVKVSREGSVIVYRGLYDTMDQYIRFIKEELLDYMIK